jgi:hypothetical protein
VLTKLELESTIIEKAKEKGLEAVKNPPQKIRVTY